MLKQCYLIQDVISCPFQIRLVKMDLFNLWPLGCRESRPSRGHLGQTSKKPATTRSVRVCNIETCQFKLCNWQKNAPNTNGCCIMLLILFEGTLRPVVMETTDIATGPSAVATGDGPYILKRDAVDLVKSITGDAQSRRSQPAWVELRQFVLERKCFVYTGVCHCVWCNLG